MFVVYNENSYKGWEYRSKAMRSSISNALHQFREVGFISLKDKLILQESGHDRAIILLMVCTLQCSE